jgi:hypothetical protein
MNHVPAFIVAQLIGAAIAALTSTTLFSLEQKRSKIVITPGE